MSRFKSLRSLSLLLVPVVAACQATEEVPTVREVPQYSIQDFLGTVNYSGASFSPDNSKLLVSNNESGIFNVYSIPVSGGDPTQLTQSADDSYYSISYFPDDERFLFTADQGGNELNHLYVRELDGTETDLTPGENLKAQFEGWANDDSSFYISTNERDQRFFDLYEYDITSYERQLLYQNDEGFSIGDISDDRRWLALHKNNSNADSDTFLFDRETEELIHLTPHEGAINFFPSRFTPDGKGLVLLTDQDSEFTHALVHDLATGEREVLAEADWDVNAARHSKEGKYLLVSINNDARTELRVFETASGQQLDLPEVPNANITSLGISRDESHMAFYASSSRMPSDLFVQELPDGEPRRLTNSINPNIDPENLVEAEVARFSSFDGVEIPGILYKPHNASAENPAPALLWVHGGPGGQSRVGYNGLIQYLVNHGYVIYAINNRGSSGYGKTFFHLDDQRHGVDDLEDCVVSKQMLIDTGYVDPRRIGILGGSYGGYMVLAALTFRPEEFAVGIDLFGISNWHRTISNIPPWWESFKAVLEKEMGPFDDMEFFRQKSPLFFAENIVRPLMVLQGANDPRVLKAESDDIVAAAKANGVPVEYVVFEDEGHGFAKNENRERGYEAILDFANEHLKSIGQGLDG
jgi:dipeptidyl aminopeptidase/acylaminoacyl peptidase